MYCSPHRLWVSSSLRTPSKIYQNTPLDGASAIGAIQNEKRSFLVHTAINSSLSSLDSCIRPDVVYDSHKEAGRGRRTDRCRERVRHLVESTLTDIQCGCIQIHHQRLISIAYNALELCQTMAEDSPHSRTDEEYEGRRKA